MPLKKGRRKWDTTQCGTTTLSGVAGEMTEHQAGYDVRGTEFHGPLPLDFATTTIPGRSATYEIPLQRDGADLLQEYMTVRYQVLKQELRWIERHYPEAVK